MASVAIAVVIASCGNVSSARTGTRYDAAAGKLCLSLISQMRAVAAQTPFGPFFAPREKGAISKLRPAIKRELLHELRIQAREGLIAGTRRSASVIESVLGELRAVPVSAAQR